MLHFICKLCKKYLLHVFVSIAALYCLVSCTHLQQQLQNDIKYCLLAQVSSPVELEQCDEETLADMLGTEARVAFCTSPHV